MSTRWLDEETWRARASAHAARVDAYVAPHLARRDRGIKHPVFDFLFSYYSFRPAHLRRWHPGFGVGLVGGQEYAASSAYSTSSEGTTVEAAWLRRQRPLIAQVLALLTATAGRPAQFGCFGLHEWAMVYRQTQEQVRHNAWPLRLGGAGTNEVVESHRISCSHFDAYRFFTPPARPLNLLRPGRDDRAAYEQPGCLHANMDLYKHAFRLSPLISSDLTLDCFELAWQIRTLDMRAAPYDLTALGDPGEWDPVPIETPEGKATYAAAQRGFAQRTEPLRARLIAECERLLTAAGASSEGRAIGAESDDAAGSAVPELGRDGRPR